MPSPAPGRRRDAATSPKPMHSMSRALLTFLVLLSAGGALAQPLAYVANGGSNSVSVIDTSTNAIAGSPIAVGPGPTAVAFNADGSRVYVGNTNGTTVSVINTATNTVVATVGVGNNPSAVSVSPDGGRVYVANDGSNTLSVISTATNTVTASVTVGASPRGVAVSPDGGRVYAANTNSNTVSVIDTASNTVIATVPVGANPLAVAFSPVGGRAYVANLGGNSVSIIDTATNAVIATAAVGSAPRAVAVAPDGSRVYVANANSDNVSVITTATNTVTSVALGNSPFGLAVTPDGSRVYTANVNNNVSVINTAGNTVVATIPVGPGTSPRAIAMGPAAAAPTPAGVTISDANPVAVLYAREIAASSMSPVTLTNTAGSLNLTSALGYSFSQGEVRHARLECPGHVRFSAGSTVVASDTAATSLGAINGLGTSVITFSITASTSGLTATDTVTVTGNRSITSTADASCSFSLYDHPSEAQAGGTAGRIITRTGAYLSFGPSWQLVADPVFTSTADVEASPAYSVLVASGDTTTTRAGLSELTYGLVTPTPLRPDSAPITLADLMATGANGTILGVVGDFTSAANADGSFTGAALSRVFLATDDTCTTLATPASALTATTATFNVGATGFTDDNLCLQTNGVAAIPAADYTALVMPTAASAAYIHGNISQLAAGRIVRNGVELQAPLVELPAGFVSRIALTNTGNVARAFTWRFVPAAVGRTTPATTGSGTIPANGLLVLALADVLGVPGAMSPRGTFIVSASAPSNAIQGLYQIVNVASGSISNTQMVRPGTN